MTSISDIVDCAFEEALTNADFEYFAECRRVEMLLAECAAANISPASDYWHKLDRLRRKVNLLREITETKK
jgi:hypothetical protein